WGGTQRVPPRCIALLPVHAWDLASTNRAPARKTDSDQHGADRKSTLYTSATTGQVELVAAVIRCPADRERRRPARRRKGVRLPSEDPGGRHWAPRVVELLDHTRAPRTLLRRHHEDEVGPL